LKTGYNQPNHKERYLESILEFRGPIQSTTSGRSGASLVHPIHTVGSDERVQTLSSLFNSFIESFRGRVSAFSQNFILSEEHSLDTTHETSSFTVQVTVDFLFKGGLVEISRSNCNTKSNSFLFGFTSDILEDGERGVDSSSFLEERSDCAAGSLGGDEDNINVSGWHDTGEILVDNGETVGEVKSLQLVGRIEAKTLPLVRRGLILVHVSL
jgi:hypothetical protein